MFFSLAADGKMVLIRDHLLCPWPGVYHELNSWLDPRGSSVLYSEKQLTTSPAKHNNSTLTENNQIQQQTETRVFPQISQTNITNVAASSA